MKSNLLNTDVVSDPSELLELVADHQLTKNTDGKAKMSTPKEAKKCNDKFGTQNKTKNQVPKQEKKKNYQKKKCLEKEIQNWKTNPKSKSNQTIPKIVENCQLNPDTKSESQKIVNLSDHELSTAQYNM